MRRSFSLLAGALVFLATVQPQAAQAQAACLVDEYGYAWDLTLDNADFLIGTAETTAPFDWYAVGTRGTTGRTIRHHTFTAINPNLSDDPSCGDGAGFVDWFAYNGQVVSGGPNYAYSGSFVSSCGVSGSVTGTITLGACPAPRVTEPVPNGPATMIAPQAAAAGTTPEGYSLKSAPNPFEAGAVISYTLPERADVRIVVYDALGRQVAVLVDEAREAGTHTVTFDGASLPSGAYLAHITAGTYTEARQMMLAR